MKKIVPFLLIILLMPLGYYLASPSGDGQGPQTGGDWKSPSEGTVPDHRGNDNPEVFLRLDKEVYSPDDTLTVEVVNDGDFNVTTGYAYGLYRLKDGKWEPVPAQTAVIMVAVIIGPGESWAQRIDLSKLDLEPGHYRIVKRVTFASGTEDVIGAEVSAEFDVKK